MGGIVEVEKVASVLGDLANVATALAAWFGYKLARSTLGLEKRRIELEDRERRETEWEAVFASLGHLEAEFILKIKGLGATAPTDVRLRLLEKYSHFYELKQWKIRMDDGRDYPLVAPSRVVKSLKSEKGWGDAVQIYRNNHPQEFDEND